MCNAHAYNLRVLLVLLLLLQLLIAGNFGHHHVALFLLPSLRLQVHGGEPVGKMISGGPGEALTSHKLPQE